MSAAVPSRRKASSASSAAGPSSSPSINAEIFSFMRLPPAFVYYHLLSLRVPSNGRSCSAIASRARKMRERTVPIGQSITLAMSS